MKNQPPILYHHPLSPNSRRVWITLIEKEIPFELVALNLDGDQFKPEFLEISPFHHVPTLVDGNFSLIESLAIMDYLEVRYPIPCLMPIDIQAMAIVRMVSLVTINELLPAMGPLMRQMMGMMNSSADQLDQAKEKTATVLQFFDRSLDGQEYFGGHHLSLGDIVAGVSIPWLPQMGMPLDAFPNLAAWCDRIQARPSWQTTQPSAADMDAFKEKMRARASAASK